MVVLSNILAVLVKEYSYHSSPYTDYAHMENLKPLRIAALSGSTGHEFLMKNYFEHPVALENENIMKKAMVDNDIDGFIIDDYIIPKLMNSLKNS